MTNFTKNEPCYIYIKQNNNTWDGDSNESKVHLQNMGSVEKTNILIDVSKASCIEDTCYTD